MFPLLLSNPSLMFHPMNTVEIPKNSKLKPTITDTNPAENIGNIMKINPMIADNIPALLVTSIFFTSLIEINYLYE